MTSIRYNHRTKKYLYNLFKERFGLGLYNNNVQGINDLACSNYRFISNTAFQQRGNRIIYESSRKGKYEKPIKLYTLENLKLGMSQLKTEIRKWREEMKEKLEQDPIFISPGDTDTIYQFKTKEDLDNWIVTSDSDHKEGFSSASLTISPVGHGLFSGNIDTRVPKDGQVHYSGYCNITSLEATRSFKRSIYYDWSQYNHLVMKVRGDGRRYHLVINTSGEFDISWHDRFTYLLFTRGGPYWQYVKIPFSKFFFAAKGRIQDKQFPIPLTRVKSLGITCATLGGPFRLEIDYIALHLDPSHKEKFAYELYKRSKPYASLG